jgi:hypothetical protein
MGGAFTYNKITWVFSPMTSQVSGATLGIIFYIFCIAGTPHGEVRDIFCYGYRLCLKTIHLMKKWSLGFQIMFFLNGMKYI